MTDYLTTDLIDGRTLTVRVTQHPRYRRVRLSIRRDGSVSLSAPKRTSSRLIRQFLREQEAWLRQHVPDADTEPELPTELRLLALDEHWQLAYGRSLEQQGTLQLSGADPLSELQSWLRARAHQRLKPWLAQVSDETGLTYNRVSIRSQRSRWGSYSSAGNVSLNDRLLFLPPELVRYVLIHELCHSLHLNHSPEYWAEVARFVPRLNEFRRRMRTAGDFVPPWLTRRDGR